MVLAVGAAVRLTRFAQADTAGRPVRWLILTVALRARGESGLIKADEMIACPWCIGWWISVATIAAMVAADGADWWRIAAGTLTLSWLVAVATLAHRRLSGEP